MTTVPDDADRLVPMSPLAALERMVYLLDRALAPSEKVKAYMRAAEIVREMGDDAVAELARAGRITELAGIGPSTGSVIHQAVVGKVPDKLVEMERTSVIPLDEGASIRAALRGDCHMHTTWSDGGASIEAMARTAQALGHEYIVITDHSPRLTIAHGLNAERLVDQLAEIERLNVELAPFRILTGIEVDILVDGSLDQDPALLERLDIVVASVHSKLSMPERQMTERMVLAIANPLVDILGHCTGRKVGTSRTGSQFDARLVFAACAMFDTAVEINCRPERQDPPDELMAEAIERGCRFVIDTDAHAPGQMEWQNYGCDKAARHGLSNDQIINTLDADAVLAWAGSHR